MRSGSAPRAWSTTTASCTTRRTSRCSSRRRCAPSCRTSSTSRSSSTTTRTSRPGGSSATARAAGTPNSLLITLGTGVGGGIIIDGRLLRGAHGFAARGRSLAVRPGGTDVRVRRARALGGDGVGHRARAAGARARGAAGDAPEVLARAGGDVERDRRRARWGTQRKPVSPTGSRSSSGYAHDVALGLAGLANILDPGDHRRVRRARRARRRAARPDARRVRSAHLEGSAHRPEVPIVAAELGRSPPVCRGGGARASTRPTAAATREARAHAPVVRRRPGDPAGGRPRRRGRRARRRVRLRPPVPPPRGRARVGRRSRVSRCSAPLPPATSPHRGRRAGVPRVAPPAGIARDRGRHRPSASRRAASSPPSARATRRAARRTRRSGSASGRWPTGSPRWSAAVRRRGARRGTRSGSVATRRPCDGRRDRRGRLERVGGRPRTTFARRTAAELRARPAPAFECSWGGLVVLDDDDAAAAAKAERLEPPDDDRRRPASRSPRRASAMPQAGADWVIAAPVDSTRPRQPRELLG